MKKHRSLRSHSEILGRQSHGVSTAFFDCMDRDDIGPSTWSGCPNTWRFTQASCLAILPYVAHISAGTHQFVLMKACLRQVMSEMPTKTQGSMRTLFLWSSWEIRFYYPVWLSFEQVAVHACFQNFSTPYLINNLLWMILIDLMGFWGFGVLGLG